MNDEQAVFTDLYIPPPSHDNSNAESSPRYADIGLPIDIKYRASISNISTQCCGAPTVIAQYPDAGSSHIIIVQKVRVQATVTYKAETRAGEQIIYCQNTNS